VQGVIHGKVYGLFGTDNQRRDLTIAMMWGTPVALTFGIVGAIVTTLTTILIAAASAWYGGFLDEILQRITELNIILPALPIVILVYMLYSKSIWVILGVMILLNIFGSSLKEYRAMFLQFKEAPYIEAAMAYGASNWRIVRKYLLPRIVQVMVPQLVIAVPSFVFLEATLAFLGVKAPYLPTWGKVVNEALSKGAYWGHYFWVLEPIVLVLITGLAFAMVGFALDSILNPRLRD
jgi:peptide/nickel transport system permease protein